MPVEEIRIPMNSDNLYALSFSQTQQTLVESLKAQDESTRNEAIANLASIYRGPLIAHLRIKRNASVDDAGEIVQNFFLEKVIVNRVIGPIRS